MKKFYLVFMLLLMVPSITSAQSSFNANNDSATFISGENNYTAGATVNSNTDINRDFYTAGGLINISNRVGQDFVAVGGTVVLSGDIGDDARIVGGNILVDGNIGGDLIVAGGQVQVKRGVRIGGNLVLNGGNVLFEGEVLGDSYINGGNLNLGGVVGGNANFNVGQVKVNSGSKINGNLYYSTSKKSQELENITSGNKEFKLMKQDYNRELKEKTIGLALGYIMFRFLFLVIFGLILYFSFERIFLETGNILRFNPGKSFLYGLIYFAVIPFLILILLMTVIGIPVGLFLLFIYIFSFVFYKLITVVVFSSLLIDKFLVDKNSFWKKTGIIVLVALIISVLSLIDFILALFAFGSLMQKKFELYNKIKNEIR